MQGKAEETNAIVSLKITVTWNNIVAMGIKRVRERCKVFLPGGLDGLLHGGNRASCITPLTYPDPIPASGLASCGWLR